MILAGLNFGNSPKYLNDKYDDHLIILMFTKDQSKPKMFF